MGFSNLVSAVTAVTAISNRIADNINLKPVAVILVDPRMAHN